MVALAGNVSSPFVNKGVQKPLAKNIATPFSGNPTASENKDALQMDFIAMSKQIEPQEPAFTSNSVITLAKTQSNPNGASEVGNNPFLSEFKSRVNIPNQ